MERWIELSPEAFVAALRGAGIERGWLAPDPASGGVRASAPELAAVASHVAEVSQAWDAHEAVFLAVGPESLTLLTATVHRSLRGQAQGGLRLMPYADLGRCLDDGLRLSRAMSRKAALAGLWWGGGKGIIARPPGDLWRDPAWREAAYSDYGRFVSALHGCYVTAEDAGTTPEDLRHVLAHSRFVTCVPVDAGGSGNPSPATAAGVLAGMEAALAFVGRGGLAGKRIAIQGLGAVGSALAGRLLAAGASVVACDLSRTRVDALTARHAGDDFSAYVAPPGDAALLAEPCDVLAPCALGGVLDPETIPRLRTRIVCGAANDPLRNPERDAAALARRAILYVPDFVVNRMGIVSCANEQYGTLNPDPAVARHLDPADPGSIQQTVARVLEAAHAAGTSPLSAAHALADARLDEPHPIWGARARIVVERVLGEWADG
jgi:glutamate dehydrogenase/leucine dehydrogenase